MPASVTEWYALKAKLESGGPLPWKEIQRLWNRDRELAGVYLKRHVSLVDLELAECFGSGMAAEALGRAPRKRVLTYRAESEHALRVAVGGRRVPALAYAYLTLRDLLRGCRGAGKKRRSVARELETLLAPVRVWLDGGSEEDADQVRMAAGRMADKVAELVLRFPDWDYALRTLAGAIGATLLACVSGTREEGPSGDQIFALKEPLCAAIKVYRAISPGEQGARKTERATFRWLEVRVAEAFERWLLSGTFPED